MRQPGEAPLVQPGEEETGIAVAEIGLAPGRVRQSRQQALGESTRAVAAAREPQRVEALVIRHLEEGARAGLVIPGKVAGRQKALRREVQLGRASGIERFRQVQDRLGDRRLQSRAGSDDPYSHPVLTHLFPRRRVRLWRHGAGL